MTAKKWTDDDLSMMRKFYVTLPIKELAARLNRTATSVKSKGKILGLKKDRHWWTDEETEILIRFYPDERGEEIADLTGHPLTSVYRKAKELGLKKSEAFKLSEKSGCIKKGERRGIGSEFRKGVAPWSKGRKIATRGRAGETQFKKGQRPANVAPVGEIRLTSKDRFMKIKVAEPNVWEFLHKKIWREAGRAIPAGHVLAFKDGNRQNCVLENLEVRSLKENMLRNTIHNYPEELKTTIQALGRLKRRINNAKKHDRRLAESNV